MSEADRVYRSFEEFKKEYLPNFQTLRKSQNRDFQNKMHADISMEKIKPYIDKLAVQ